MSRAESCPPAAASAVADTAAASPIPTHWHKRVLSLAFPIVLANLTQPLLGAVDTAVAGHLGGAEPLGGVALGGLFFSFVFWSFGFLRMGTTGLVAQSFGAGDRNGMRSNFIRSACLAIVIGALILLVQKPLMHGALHLIGGSERVVGYAISYCQARIWAAPLALLNYVILGYLLGCQRVRLAVMTQIFINGVNMLAVWAYVAGFHAGVHGIGQATATADLAGFILGMAIIWRLRFRDLPPLAWASLLETHALRRLITINRDIFVRTLCLLASVAWFTHVGAKQGDVVLAANAILLNFQTFTAFGLDGFAHAAEALVGATAGAGQRSAFRQAVKITLFWSFIGAALFSLFFLLFGPTLIGWLTSAADVRTTALRYLPWAVIMPLVSVLGFQLDGVFIGATRTRELMFAMAACLAVFLLAAWLAVRPWGNHGLWLALSAFMMARGVSLAVQLPKVSRKLFCS